MRLNLNNLTHRLKLKLKILSQDAYRVIAVKEGERCPAEDFLIQGEKTTAAHRAGLVRFIQEIARNGLQQVPSAWWHEANKEHGIYELIKGPLRLSSSRAQIATSLFAQMARGNLDKKQTKPKYKKRFNTKRHIWQPLKNTHAR
jgi:hypothetical protein